MRGGNDELDRLRSERTELENHYIDELVSGHMDRRDFLRRGSMIGMSVPLLGAILAACGGSSSSSTASGSGAAPSSGKKGGTLRIAGVTPAAAINPLTVADAGGLLMLNQTGEFLIFDSNLKLALQPMLALSWKPNADGSVWTFKLRPGVTFHDGKQMTADDVVYTFKQLSDPKVASNALSTFTGVLTPDGVKKVDATTRRVPPRVAERELPLPGLLRQLQRDHRSRRNGLRPVAEDVRGNRRVQARQLPTERRCDRSCPTPTTGGPSRCCPGASSSSTQVQQPMILALQGGDVDVIAQFVPAGATQLLNSSTYKIIQLKSANHRELSMRNDQPPFNDAKVRQAVAYSLDRTGMVAALLSGKGTVANDYPFGPRFPSTDTTVPQRSQNIAMAKQLLQQAGHSSINATLFTEQYQEIPQLAQAIQQNAKQAGININLKVETQTAYYGKATYGNSDWLDGQMSLVDYGDRGVPNVYLVVAADLQGPVERGALQEPAVRLAGQAVRGRARPPDPEDDRRQDPAAPACRRRRS